MVLVAQKEAEKIVLVKYLCKVATKKWNAKLKEFPKKYKKMHFSTFLY